MGSYLLPSLCKARGKLGHTLTAFQFTWEPALCPCLCVRPWGGHGHGWPHISWHHHPWVPCPQRPLSFSTQGGECKPVTTRLAAPMSRPAPVWRVGELPPTPDPEHRGGQAHPDSWPGAPQWASSPTPDLEHCRGQAHPETQKAWVLNASPPPTQPIAPFPCL